jgi:hypothetical protein
MLKGLTISDVEDSNEIKLLNQKRVKENLNEHPNKKPEIPFRMNKPLHQEKEIQFTHEIQEAFKSFTNFDKESFVDHFNRLETNINSKTNLIELGISNDDLPSIVDDKFIDMHDEEYENSKKPFEYYKSNEEYYNMSSNPKKRKLEVQDGREILYEQMKEVSKDLKSTNSFVKDINTIHLRNPDNYNDIETCVLSKNKEEKMKIRENRRKMFVLSSCNRCYGGKLDCESVISESSNVYLAYPFLTGSITDFHVVISTKEHTNSLAAVEENVYEEIRNYMKSIVSYNLVNDMATIFIEFSKQADQISHFEMECIPIKYKYLEDARLYFNKAFTDQDDEWTTNKKLVDTTSYKGNLTKIINEKFAYVNVDFNAQGGYLHPIENNKKFSQTFLREIFSPLLKKPSHELKYPKKLGLKELLDQVDLYKKRFDYYDWTKYSK